MKSYADFVEAASSANLHLRVDTSTEAAPAADALFHLPLLALSILTVSSTRSRALYTSELSTWIAALLSQQFSGLRVAKRKLEWSVTLRARCAEALVFLEGIGFVTVQEKTRRITLTSTGREFLSQSKKAQTEIGILTRSLFQAEGRVRVTGRTLF